MVSVLKYILSETIRPVCIGNQYFGTAVLCLQKISMFKVKMNVQKFHFTLKS